MLDSIQVYARRDLAADAIAGLITAALLVPQAIAYSQLAGLPPEIGLYASMLPPILYALVGSSGTLSVGPVAIASVLLANVLGAQWQPGSAEYVAGAALVSLFVGALLLLLGLVRAGVLMNYLSHPVLSGFTNAAALLILASQVPVLIGGNHWGDLSLQRLLNAPAPFALGTVAVGLLLLASWMNRRSTSQRWSLLLRMTPAGVAIGGALLVSLLDWQQVPVVGTLSGGLPRIALPSMDWQSMQAVASGSLVVAVVSAVESLAIAKVLAARRRQSIVTNREFVALGLANLGSAVSGASPVCGGFSRSAVNFEAGARTQMAGVITAATIAISGVFFTAAFENLPNAILAAIVITSVATLLEARTLKLCWRYPKPDAAAWAGTFVGVLVLGIESGVAVGVVISIGLYLWRTVEPHVAIVGRVVGTEHFRNVLRHKVQTYPGLLLIRVDESLYFANAETLAQRIQAEVARDADCRAIILVFSAVNYVDTSALETLESLVDRLRDMHVTLHLAEVKGPVMDRLSRVDFVERLKPGNIYLSTDRAVRELQSNG